MFGSPNLEELAKKIEQDVLAFVNMELLLYQQAMPSADLSNSVIINMAVFDLMTLGTERGYNQMINLFTVKQDQRTAHRLLMLRSILYIRYGDDLKTIIDRCYKTLTSVYKIEKNVVRHLANATNDGLWLIPFVQNAYSIIRRVTS